MEINNVDSKYQHQDTLLQKRQNRLILLNTIATIFLGALAVLMQFLEVIVSWFK